MANDYNPSPAETKAKNDLSTNMNQNPLYLHPLGSPGLVLVSQPFDGKNYNSWLCAMGMALNAKNKLGFVDGSISQLDAANPQALHLWQHNNSILVSWILNQVSKKISASVICSPCFCNLE
ncbi:hypothetical protein CR513_11455, partial [Mucuna pruriens]